MQWKVLHVTDLHIGQFADQPALAAQHPLRERKFKEYISELTQLFRSENLLPDCIIATGDFVDRRQVDYFSHAEQVLRFLAEECGLTAGNIVVCPGNHDVIRELDEQGNDTAARQQYKSFATKFCPPTLTIGKRAELCQPADRIWCLSLDSTLGAKGAKQPGPLTPPEVDELCEAIHSHVPADDLFILATHYPIISVSDSKTHASPDWQKAHVIGGNSFELGLRLARLRPSKPTLVASGDTHAPDQVYMNGIRHLMTGAIGTGPSQSLIPRQVTMAVLIDDIEPGQQWRARTASFTMPDDQYADSPDLGKWRLNPSRPFRLPGSAELSRRTVPIGRVDNVRLIRRDVTCLNANLESQILNTIRRRRLYHLGRYQTTDSTSCLAWISIGALLNEEGILPLVVSRMTEFLEKRGVTRGNSDSILIGIDFWGAVFATQLSVRLGVENVCIPARTHGESYGESKQLSSQVVESVINRKNIILLTDVVATGESIRFVYEYIQSLTRGFKHKPVWSALSLISATEGSGLVDLSVLSTHCSACTKLRIPILANEELPDERMFPTQLSIRRVRT